MQATSCLGVLVKMHDDDDSVRPTLEDVEADAAESVDVGVVDLGEEAHFRRCHGVVVWEEELKLEDAA